MARAALLLPLLLQPASAAPLRPSPPIDECDEAISGGTPEQRRSLDPEDKAAVHELVCSERCADAARSAYGGRAFELFCQSPGAVTDPHGGIWGLAAPKTQQTSELGIARGPGDTVGCFGGISAIGLTVDTAEVFDGETNRWSPATPLPLRTNHPMPASTAGGRVFLAGGGLFPLGQPDRDTLFEFSPSESGGEWHERQRMPTSRSAGAAAEVDGLLYFAGGWPPRGSDFARYDPSADEWVELSTMHSQRNHLVVAAAEDMIIAAGGRTSARPCRLARAHHEAECVGVGSQAQG